MNTEQEVIRKNRNKKKFLNELKGALSEIKEAEVFANETGVQFGTAFDTVKKNGGVRPRAGAPRKRIVALNRSVKLTDSDYQKIISKYGSFSKGVKTLLMD